MDRSGSKMVKCATKTDLNLLLDCLKHQMNCPDTQKQALLTIYSICQEKGKVIDYFQELGGVLFVYNLSKSSQHLEVKEAALFTLGGLAENNVFCQQILCRADMFAYMVHVLVETSPMTLKRLAVYMVSVLVANNKSGQTLAKSTGCLDVLLDLFRTSFPFSSGDVKPANISQLCQLWTSVSSALCGCVNNPQNEENQLICMTIFPEAKTWLETLTLPRLEIMQPIMSLIGMIVANNSSAQESFAATGGLQTLALSLVRFTAESSRSPLARDLAVMATKTLSACITDKGPLASALTQYHLVPQLLTLLSCPGLDPQNRLCIVLAVGHCTESCEEHQLQLLGAGGLSIIIQLLTESQEEELRKAATFVLHTCKHITSTLRTDGPSPSPRVDPDGTRQLSGAHRDLQPYWRSARDVQSRIAQLEKLQGEGVRQREGLNSSDKSPALGEAETLSHLLLRRARGRGRGEGATACWGLEGPAELERTPARSGPPTQPRPPPLRRKSHSSARDEAWLPMGSVRRLIFQSRPAPHCPAQPSCSTTLSPLGGASEAIEPVHRGAIVRSVCARMPPSATPPVSGRPEELKGVTSPPATPPERQVIFKRPHPAKQGEESRFKPVFRDHMTLCADVLEDEIRRILRSPDAKTQRPALRCSGCAAGLSQLNSRSFGRILRSCRHRCDRHTALLEAETRFKEKVRNEADRGQRDVFTHISLTPTPKGPSLRPAPSQLWSRPGPSWISLTPVKRTLGTEDEKTYHRPGPTPEKHQEARRADESTSNRRERKNFTQEEVWYLLDGVRELGPHWNAILWTYPFQNGRTNVDLAKKYARLQKQPSDGPQKRKTPKKSDQFNTL